MGCFIGGVVGLYLSYIGGVLGVILAGFFPPLAALGSGLALFAIDEGYTLMRESDDEKKEPEWGFVKGLLAGPAFFWGIAAVVISCGLIVPLLKPFEKTPKPLRRQFYVLLVLWLAAAGLFTHVSNGLGSNLAEAKTIDAKSLYSMSPGVTVKIQGEHVTRLNQEYYVLELNQELVLVRVHPDTPESLTFTGSTVKIPTPAHIYAPIAADLRTLRKKNPTFDHPLFGEALVDARQSKIFPALKGPLTSEPFAYLAIVLICGALLVPMLRVNTSKVGDSLAGGFFAALGVLLLALGLMGFYLLDDDKRKVALGETEFAELVRPISAEKVDPANDGMPVLITGEIQTPGILEDKPFGVKFEGMLAFYREISMLQNDEVWSGDEMTGHVQVWSDEYIPCHSKHNPRFPVLSKYQTADVCKVGAFTIPKVLVSELQPLKAQLPDLNPDQELAALGKWEKEGRYLSLTVIKERVGQIHLRLRYLLLEPAFVTVVGMQQGNNVVPYYGPNGGEIFGIYRGKRGPAAIRGSMVPADSWLRQTLQGLPVNLSFLRIPFELIAWMGFFLLFSSGYLKRRADALNLMLAGLAAGTGEILISALVRLS